MHFILSLLLTVAPSFAAEHKVGVGFVLGDPNALSAKYEFSGLHAVDAQISFSNDYVLLYGDYHWRFPGIFQSDQKFVQQLTPYMGAGPVLVFASKGDHGKGNYFDKHDDRMALGARLPFGIEWRWDKVPLGVGLEIAPGVVVVPATTAFLHGGVTFRYYF